MLRFRVKKKKKIKKRERKRDRYYTATLPNYYCVLRIHRTRLNDCNYYKRNTRRATLNEVLGDMNVYRYCCEESAETRSWHE